MQTEQKNRIDKYKAIWMSHSSLQDYEKCPRLYYLHNIYKDKKTGRKINIVSPHMSLGIAVHNVLENLINYNSEERVHINLLEAFEKEWVKFAGEIGGFENIEQEKEFKDRGLKMLLKVQGDFKMLAKKTIPLKSYYDGDMLPNIYLSEYENIILCGNIDWIEYDEKNKNLKVIDFKTGKNEEREDSIQLPIYKLLLQNLQSKWPVADGYYWYLENGIITEKKLDKVMIEGVKNKILTLGVEIRDKRFSWNENTNSWEPLKNVEENFVCIKNEFCDCQKYEKIISGNAKYLGIDMYGKDSYKV